MASVISLRSGIAQPVRHDASGSIPGRWAAGRLLRAFTGFIRRDRAARELRRLSDRHLRDIGLERKDVGGPPHATVAWDAATWTWLHPGTFGP